MKLHQARRYLRFLPLILVGAGIFLRLQHYSNNLSFWSDEAWVALDTFRRSFADILLGRNLYEYYSILPVGLLLIEKASVAVLGERELALRLFPVFCGALSVVAYAWLLRRYFTRTIALLALAFFAFSNPLIYYSAQVKQYPSDLLAVLLLYGCWFSLAQGKSSTKKKVILSCAGVAALGISQPALLILGGIGAGQVVADIDDQEAACRYLPVYIAWSAGFAFFWLVYYRAFFLNPILFYPHLENFLPSPFSLVGAQEWIARFLSVFNDPVDLSLGALAAFFFMIGVAALYRKNKRICLQLVAPLLLTLLAAAVRRYPFSGRFLIFLVPALLVGIAAGFERLIKAGKVGPLVAGILLIAVWGRPLAMTLRHTVTPRSTAEMRPLMRYLKEHQRDGDLIYINNDAQYGFSYYARYFKMRSLPRVAGVLLESDYTGRTGVPVMIFEPSRNRYLKVGGWNKVSPLEEPSDAPQGSLAGAGRTWVLFAQLPPATERTFLNYLNEGGTRIGERTCYNASLFLYDLKSSKR